MQKLVWTVEKQTTNLTPHVWIPEMIGALFLYQKIGHIRSRNLKNKYRYIRIVICSKSRTTERVEVPRITKMITLE